MAVITITVTESPYQKVSGIPSTVSLSTNTPATIFYTLDGTNPDTTSSVYVTPIDLPSFNTVILKIFATDGVDSSSIITETYKTDLTDNRNPRDTSVNTDNLVNKATFPYGSPAASLTPDIIWGNVGGNIVDDQQAPRVSDGYDYLGNETRFLTPPVSQYDFIFSETNSIGQRGKGIGTLPAQVTYVYPRHNNDAPISSDANSAYFNPRALVIFHDSGEEPYHANTVKINRPYFGLERFETTRDKALLTVTDGLAPSGSLLRQHFNPRDNTLTYYYYDNRTGRWIISKEPFVANHNTVSNLSNIVFSSRDFGSRHVFKWVPFKYSRIRT